ncbi:Rho GTPase activation protein [Lanmaoa asiatica]|nr:Rho GTPase activation protein [Lanmaoa asiatica]
MVPDNHPSKASLLKWWSQFTQSKKLAPTPDEHPVFAKPLKDSLRRASVQISTSNANGDLYVWGYIPVVVAKCGLYLKENGTSPSFVTPPHSSPPATEVEGTFRVNGSAKRMRELQAAFETPPRYGKSLDWKSEHYNTHDVASVFRRYLTQMPVSTLRPAFTSSPISSNQEPVIPHDMYHDVSPLSSPSPHPSHLLKFRDVLARQPFNHDNVVATYRRLISRMPRANQYLLLYVLDLLSVFARKSDKNLMTAASPSCPLLLSPLLTHSSDLAVIFRPGLISHPNHELSPGEHHLSQKVLEFLIDQQDCFLLDIPPPPRPDPSSWRPPPRPAPHHHLHEPDDPDLVLPSSDDEHPSTGGWKLVGKDNRRIARRRTTHEPLGGLPSSAPARLTLPRR